MTTNEDFVHVNVHGLVWDGCAVRYDVLCTCQYSILSVNPFSTGHFFRSHLFPQTPLLPVVLVHQSHETFGLRLKVWSTFRNIVLIFDLHVFVLQMRCFCNAPEHWNNWRVISMPTWRGVGHSSTMLSEVGDNLQPRSALGRQLDLREIQWLVCLEIKAKLKAWWERKTLA